MSSAPPITNGEVSAARAPPSASSPSSSSPVSRIPPPSAIPVPRSSVQEKLLYAIDLLRKSEIEKQELLDKLKQSGRPILPQRKQRRRRKSRQTSEAGAEEGEGEVDDGDADADGGEEFEEKEAEDEQLQPEADETEVESKQAERVQREQRQQQQQPAPAAAVAGGHRRRTSEGASVSPHGSHRPSAVAAAPSKPAASSSTRQSQPSTPRKALVKEAEKSVTPQRRSTAAAASSSSSSSIASPVRNARSTAVKPSFSTPPARRTVSAISTPRRSSPPSSTSPSVSVSPAPPTRKSAGKAAAAADESSVLQTLIRFVFSPAHLVTYRGSVSPSPTRFETIEWLRVEAEGGEEEEEGLTSIHSESLRGRGEEEETTVMINTKRLSDGDMQREVCVQLWTHSDDVDAVDMESGHQPQHDLLLQFTATVPEMAEFTQWDDADGDDDGDGGSRQDDEEERERRQQIADFFVSVEVVLEEQQRQQRQGKQLDLEIAIEQERMRMLVEQQARGDKTAAAAAAAATVASASRATRSKQAASSPATPQRSASAGASLLAPTLSSQLSAVFPTLPDDMSELIMPDRVFARRQRMKAEEQKRKVKRPEAAAGLSVSGGSRSHDGALQQSPNSSRPSSPQLEAAGLSFAPFEPVYYRVRVSVADLPKMNFHGTADSYFHILLAAPSSSSSSSPSSWQSIYRSEVQFNQLSPRFASFVLSSVRERDMQRQILLRMINWRQRVEEGHEEVIGEVTVALSTLIPSSPPAQADSQPAVIPPLQLHLVNPVRSYIGMRTAAVGVCTFQYSLLSGSLVSVDTMPSSGLKSVRQQNQEESKAVRRKQKEMDKERGDKAAAEQHKDRGRGNA